MTSKIVVNNIEADAGVSTVFFNSDIGATGGTLSVDGNLNVDGVITYEDVTSVDSVGIITARNGIDVTDKGVQVGTGATVDSAASNTLSFLTGGSERLRIDSNGKLILTPGVDSGNIIQLNGADATSEILELGINATGNVQLTATHASGGSNTCGFIFRTRGGGGGTTEKLRITSGGLVGIGSDAPTQKLDVSGNIKLDGSDQYMYLSNVGTGNAGIYVRGRSANSELRSHSTGIFTWEVTGNEKMRLTSAGNLGIGNIVPRGIVHVGADLASGATDAAAINLKQTSTTAATGIYLERSGERRGYAIYVGGGLDSLNFQRNNAGTKSDVMTMTRDGNVGLGLVDPGTKLEISGGQNQTANTFVDLFRIAANANNDSLDAEMQLNFGISASHTSTANRRARIQAKTHAGTARELLINPDGGYIGIGTDDPTHPLHINSTGTSYVKFSDEASGAGGTQGAIFGLDNPHLYAWNYQAGDFVVATSATERLRIDSNGDAIFQGNPSIDATDLYYTNSYTTGSWTTNNWYTVVPHGLTGNCTYLVSLVWDYGGSGGSPYYLATQQLYSTVNSTNGTLTENELTPMCGTHTGGTGCRINCRVKAQAAGSSAMQVGLNWTQSGNNYLKVKVWKILFSTRT